MNNMYAQYAPLPSMHSTGMSDMHARYVCLQEYVYAQHVCSQYVHSQNVHVPCTARCIIL